MRFSVLTLSVLLSFGISAQVYMRKKENFGVYGGGNFKNAEFNTLQFGLTTNLLHFFEPEIGLRATLPLKSSNDFTQPHNVYFTTGLNIRKSLFPIYQRMLEIFAAPEYNFLLKSHTDRYDLGQFSVRAGLGLFHYQTGFSRSNKAWQVKAQVYYRYVPGPSTNTMSIKNEFGVQLRIFKFKTFDFVN
jgi:hypothetical protein